MNRTLWTRNFSLVTIATTLGALGSIAGGFALSFFVFDETGSTLASALIIAIRFVPHIFLPLIVAPWMDRLPRKTFLVIGDMVNGIAYAAMGLWLMWSEFSYVGYLAVSLVLACLQSVDELAYTSLYPDLIPGGMEQKGYAVSSMLFPIITVIMTPISAVLLDTLGVAVLLLLQGVMSVAASVTESFIRMDERTKREQEPYTFSAWRRDIREAGTYLRQEKGLLGIFGYMSVTNGVATGYAPVLVAFFRTMPGMTAAMYSLFSVVEFIGRTVGSSLQYKVKIPKKKRFGLCFLVYQVYEWMDMLLLWLPYPLMLVNRLLIGFLGSNSAILRSSAVQRYIPEQLRSRVNAFNSMLMTAAGSVFTLLVGGLGEILDYRVCVTLCGAVSLTASWLFIWGGRNNVRRVYEAGAEEEN